MELKDFVDLPTAEVARLVREDGPKVCVFPINGTRRWFMLEHRQAFEENPVLNYLDIAGKRHIELYQLFFDHGVDTLLTPVFGPDLLERGRDYVQGIGAEGLARLATHPDFLNFYEAHNVRVRFYGDYHKVLADTPYGYLLDLFDEVTMKTEMHIKYRLFFGVFANDAAETIAELSINYYLKHKSKPDKRTLVELYYGEYVLPVDMFIGFDKLSAFDMPLLATGDEDLYFTVAPSPYMAESQLRAMLYDHLYVRPEDETDYSDLTSEGLNAMHDFYRANVGNTLGVGARSESGSFWYPLPKVEIPDGLNDAR